MPMSVADFNRIYGRAMWCPCLIHSRIGHKLIAKLDKSHGVRNTFHLHMATCPEVSKK